MDTPSCMLRVSKLACMLDAAADGRPGPNSTRTVELLVHELFELGRLDLGHLGELCRTRQARSIGASRRRPSMREVSMRHEVRTSCATARVATERSTTARIHLLLCCEVRALAMAKGCSSGA